MKPGSRSRWAAAAIGGAVFLLAFAVRASNARVAFAGASPQVNPVDELYHAKRIVHSALHPLTVLDFDPARGVAGAFCPWPPLYDLAAGTAATAMGGHTPVAVLRRAVWFPPVIAAIGAGLLAAVLARRRGALAGILAGTALALCVPFLDRSRVGSIDHHFLEPLLVFGILGALYGVREARRETIFARAAIFGLVLAAALLIQPALLLAAAVSAACVLLFRADRVSARAAGAAGFGIAAATVLVYRATLPAGRPDDEWFLGVPHVAALLGAAAACAADAWLLSRGARRIAAAALSVLVGAATLATVPTALPALLSGSRFFGGDPWLAQITEFGPLFFRRDSVFLLDLALLGGGALLLVAAIALDRRWRSGFRGVLASFAVVYAVAAAGTNRFLIVAASLAAVAGALVVADLASAHASKGLVAVAACVLLVPSAFLAAGRVLRPLPPVSPRAAPWIRAAGVLRENPRPGRVLPPWSWGHLFDVVGARPVLVDNFGAAVGRTEFENSLGILLSPREGDVARFLRANGARFVVLENPYPNMGVAAASAGYPGSAYPIDAPPTPLMRASFWWRAYFAPGDSPRIGDFRRIDATPEPDGVAPDLRSAVQIWELLEPAGP